MVCLLPLTTNPVAEICKCRILRGANASSLSNMNPENKRRDLIILAALIEYPGVGLILFETGCAENIEMVGSSQEFMTISDPRIEMGRPNSRYIPSN